MHGFPSFLLVGGGAKIGISVFDIILVIMLGFPSFLLVGGGAKIGISVFDIILVIIHGFPSFLLVGVRGEAGLCPKLELLLQGGGIPLLGGIMPNFDRPETQYWLAAKNDPSH